MKVLMLILGSTVAVVAGLPSRELCETMGQSIRSDLELHVRSETSALRSLRSSVGACDVDDDGTLAFPEFAGCLHRLILSEKKIDLSELKTRVMCFQNFMQEADANGDLKVSQREFLIWIDGSEIISISHQSKEAEEMNDDKNTVLSVRNTGIGDLISKLAEVLRALSDQNVPKAIALVFDIMSNTQLSDTVNTVLAAVMQALNENNIPEAIGKIYSILSETTDEAAVGIIGLSTRTVKSVAALLQAVISNSPPATIRELIAVSVAGVLTDFSFLSSESAVLIAEVIRSIIENNGLQLNSAFYTSLTKMIDGISELNVEIKTALKSLIQSAAEGNNNKLIIGIFQVVSKIFNLQITIQDGDKFAATLAAIIQAVIEGNSGVAIGEIIKLFSLITSGGSGSGGNGGSGGGSGGGGGGGGSGGNGTITGTLSQETRAVLTLALEALNSGSIGTAIVRMNTILYGSGAASLSADIRKAIMAVITEINAGNLANAITQLTLILSVSSEETTSSATITALAQAIEFLNKGEVTSAANMISALLSGTSSVSEEHRTLLSAILTLLNNGKTVEALAQLNLIVNGNSNSGGGSTTSAAEKLAAALQALESGDKSKTRSLLVGLQSDSSLSEETKSYITVAIKYLDQNNNASALTQIYLALAGINNDGSSITSQTITILRALLVSISSGEVMLSINQLRHLLTSSSTSSTISASLKILLSAALKSLESGDKEAAASQINVVIEIGTGIKPGSSATTTTTTSTARTTTKTTTIVPTSTTTSSSTQTRPPGFLGVLLNWLFGPLTQA